MTCNVCAPDYEGGVHHVLRHAMLCCDELLDLQHNSEEVQHVLYSDDYRNESLTSSTICWQSASQAKKSRVQTIDVPQLQCNLCRVWD